MVDLVIGIGVALGFALALAMRRLRVAVSGVPVDNVPGRLTVIQFARHHVRRARIRQRIARGGYLGELLLNPTALALLGAAVSRTSDALALAGVTLAGMSILDGLAEQNLKARRPLYHYPCLELIRSMVVITTWPIPFPTRRVSWRGTKFRIGSRTRLTPLSTMDPPPSP